jgi:hypothetical protein
MYRVSWQFAVPFYFTCVRKCVGSPTSDRSKLLAFASQAVCLRFGSGVLVVLSVFSAVNFLFNTAIKITES